MGLRFSAMLHVDRPQAAIEFYQRAFGARVGWSTPPGEDMVAQLLVEDAEFWVHPASDALENPAPRRPGVTAVRLMLIASDPDALFARAVAAGATVRAPMRDHEYGWRDGSLADPFGHRWEIGKPLL